jgi:hypothetical protein
VLYHKHDLFNVTKYSQPLLVLGFDDGTATGNVIGGTSPYTIAWSDPTIIGFFQDAACLLALIL